jgi:ketosteroid isomerase-like protein
MKNLLILCSLFLSLFAFGSENQNAGELNEIYKSFNELNEAVNTVNIEKALLHIDERIIFVNIPGTVTIGHGGIRRYFDIMLLAKDAYLKSAQFEFKIDGEPLIIDNKIAFAHGHSINHYTFSTGNKMDMPVDWTGSMVKVNNQWKVISLHVAGNVFKNPLLDKVYWIMGICFSLILIIFSTVFYFLGRKSRNINE